jgi:hypothetical protein
MQKELYAECAMALLRWALRERERERVETSGQRNSDSLDTKRINWDRLPAL